MKEHKHKWILIHTLFPNIFDEDLVVYYICEECQKYKKIRYKKQIREL